MSVLREDVAESSRKYLYYIPIGCAIFTFIYWFVATPLLWSVVETSRQESFSTFLLMLGGIWVLIIAVLLVVWCCKYKDNLPLKRSSKVPKDRVSIVNKDLSASSRSNSPAFPTKAEAVQPCETPVSYKARYSLVVGADKDDLTTISLNSWPIQPQNTPSLYNAKTGRQSYEAGYPEAVVLPKRPSSADILEKRISSSSSATSIDIGDGLKESDRKKNKDSDNDTDVIIETAIIETHNITETDCDDEVELRNAPRLSSKDSFKGLPEMNAFDGYLHLTTVDTPMSPPKQDEPNSAGLTPREIFFSDLYQQAEESERKASYRRSFCLGDSLMPRDVDKRKSMPLHLYLTSSPPPYEEAVPMSVDDSDYSLSSPTQTVTRDELQSNLERMQSEPEAGKRHSSGGEYFIANVAPRQKSLLSEVHIDITGETSPPRQRNLSTMQWRIVGDALSVDTDGYASDDCVFEDDVKAK